jgi:hypothetical protein
MCKVFSTDIAIWTLKKISRELLLGAIHLVIQGFRRHRNRSAWKNPTMYRIRHISFALAIAKQMH